MSNPVFVRAARNTEGSKFFNWSVNVPGFDPEIAYQPGVFTLASYNKKHVISFMPVQRPYMLETIAKNPEATDAEAAIAFKEFIQFLVSQAHIQGVSEIYFLGTDDSVNNIAEATIFEPLPYTVYKAKIRDLEPEQEQ
jgi:hypothetical protein